MDALLTPSEVPDIVNRVPPLVKACAGLSDEMVGAAYEKNKELELDWEPTVTNTGKATPSPVGVTQTITVWFEKVTGQFT